MTAARMPVLFIGHGSPTNMREDNVFTRSWHDMVQGAPKPSAILVISAHWYTNGTGATAMAHPRTIHDFGRSLGDDLFSYSYPAPGSPALAARIADLLAPTEVVQDQSWGLDHGAWAVLIKAAPAADIPVVQLSLDGSLPAEQHYTLAQKLRPLRDEGVLIIASGNIVHNLGIMQWGDGVPPYDWAVAFNEFVKKCITENDPAPLFDPGARGEEGALSVPHPDHYLPLIYAMGARDDKDSVTFLTDEIVYRSLSMTSVEFNPHQ